MDKLSFPLFSFLLVLARLYSKAVFPVLLFNATLQCVKTAASASVCMVDVMASEYQPVKASQGRLPRLPAAVQAGAQTDLGICGTKSSVTGLLLRLEQSAIWTLVATVTTTAVMAHCKSGMGTSRF